MSDNTLTELTIDTTAALKAELLRLVPAAFADGAFNPTALLRLLGAPSESAQERYGLTWAGKNDAYRVLQAPTFGTLRPQADVSLHFENAAHVFIEGENLEVLKIIQKAYFSR